MKKRLAALIIVVAILFVIIGIAIAEEIAIIATVPWEDSDWQTTWHEVSSLEPITAVFTGTVQVRRPASGEVIFSQDADTTCVPPEDQPGVGACQVQAPPIDTDDFEPEELELWSRAGWIVPGYLKPLWFVWSPADCNLADAGCTIIVGTGTGVTIPPSCRSAIEDCGSVQDAQGYWRMRTFRGTKLYDIYLPLIMVEES